MEREILASFSWYRLSVEWECPLYCRHVSMMEIVSTWLEVLIKMSLGKCYISINKKAHWISSIYPRNGVCFHPVSIFAITCLLCTAHWSAFYLNAAKYLLLVIRCDYRSLEKWMSTPIYGICPVLIAWFPLVCWLLKPLSCYKSRTTTHSVHLTPAPSLHISPGSGNDISAK